MLKTLIFGTSLALTLALPFYSLAADAPTELPTTSKFADKLAQISYPVTSGPDGPVAIKMDFSGSDIYSYDFAQDVDSRHSMGAPQQSPGQEIAGSGELLLKSRGDRTANLVIKDLALKQTVSIDGQTKTMEMTSPPLVVPGVQENGRMQAGFNSQNVMFQLLFPLPEKKLERGDTFENDLAIPFNLAGSVLPVSGKSTSTLTDFVVIDGELCARLDTVIAFDEPNVPEELEADLKTEMNGRSVSFFNIEKGCFQRGDIAFLMAFSMSSQMPQFEGVDKEAGESFGEEMQVELVNDNYISYALKRIGPAGAD